MGRTGPKNRRVQWDYSSRECFSARSSVCLWSASAWRGGITNNEAPGRPPHPIDRRILRAPGGRGAGEAADCAGLLPHPGRYLLHRADHNLFGVRSMSYLCREGHKHRTQDAATTGNCIYCKGAGRREQLKSRRCPGCGQPCRNRYLACRSCWRSVPRIIRDEFWAAVSAKDKLRMRAALRAAIESVRKTG